MTDVLRYRFDELRQFASSLAAGVGVQPARASALASHLLWFDAAGAPSSGIATLADTLDQIESQSIDAKTEGVVGLERGSTTVLDGRHGIALLVLDRAGGLATEKARDTGVGLVRVKNVGPTASAAGIAAEMAIGPYFAFILGPGTTLAIALPSENGLPVVFDPVFGVAAPRDGSATLSALTAPWATVLAPEGGWLVAAVAVKAMESLSTFHERVADALKGLDESAGRLLPDAWEARRREAREHGIAVEPATWERLTRRAEGLGVIRPGTLQRNPSA